MPRLFPFQIHFLFLLVAIILAGIVLWHYNTPISYTFHDTYFALDSLTVGVPIIIYHLIYFTAYYFLRKRCNYWLGILHFIFGLASFIAVPIYLLSLPGEHSAVTIMYEPGIGLYVEEPISPFTIFKLIGFGFFVGQLLFTINLALAIIKIRKKNAAIKLGKLE